MESISLVVTAMAFCNRTSTLVGGSGCTVHPPTPTSSKGLLANVRHSVICMLVSVLILYSAAGRSAITCAPIEYVSITPPSGQTCQQYLGQYINNFGGYITNPGAANSCQFCPYRTTDAFLESNSNIFYSHHWRNFGFMWVYVGFNVRRLLYLSSAINLNPSFVLGADICYLCHDVCLPCSWTRKSFFPETVKCIICSYDTDTNLYGHVMRLL
jgi:ABC-type multidrug transport system permease subunit